MCSEGLRLHPTLTPALFGIGLRWDLRQVEHLMARGLMRKRHQDEDGVQKAKVHYQAVLLFDVFRLIQDHR